MSAQRLFRSPQRSARNADPVTLPTGQLALALAGALCGPAALRSVREPGAGARARVVLVFEHQSVGRLELAVRATDERTQRAVRDLRVDPAGFARLLAVLACALKLDGEPGRFTYETVHRLTHGPGAPNVDRSRLNKPVAELLSLLASAALTWTPPAGSGRRPRAAVEIGPLLAVDEVNRKARTVRVAPAARPLLTHYSLQTEPAAFLVTRSAGGRSRPPAAVLARLRLAALIAARFRHAQPQRTSFSALLERFAWVTFDTPTQGGGAAEAAGRALRPRLREAVSVLGDELGDPGRYGAGLMAEVTPCSRAALRSMFALGLASDAPAAEDPQAVSEPDEPAMQPTLEDGRLRAADAPPMFPPARPEPAASGHDRAAADSLDGGHDDRRDSLAQGQDDPTDSLARGQYADRTETLAGGQPSRPDAHASRADTPAAPKRSELATVGVGEMADGRVLLEFANGFGVVLPPEIAQAAGLHDSLAGGQDGAQHAERGSLAYGQRFPRKRPGWEPDSLAQDHNAQPQLGSAAGIPGPESFSDDSDRAREERLTAPLAPRTARPDPPPADDPARARAIDYDEHPTPQRRSA